MHEMAITRSVVDAVCAHAAGRRVYSVTVEVGALCAVVPDAMRFCFEIVAESTAAEGAELILVEIPGLAVCRSCGVEFGLADPIPLCSCGSADVRIRSGHELRIRSMEVSQTCARPADAATTPPR
ncbi:hydrogenase maturation nickel metallochaperone HypA [Nocardia sp. 004]|uniref:hydrogenase maturation nickel metallochaperone HypA/HybF n=1 Tax=Nocardia sp. 004 TaxID=3385978 RepID=UPI00399F6B51